MTTLEQLDRRIADLIAMEKISELKRKINMLTASTVKPKQTDIRITLMRATTAKLERQLTM